MKNKKIILFIAFAFIASTQIFVPLNMIWEKDDILKSGTVFKFYTAPLDPTDPFRGEYISLDFSDIEANVENEKEWEIGEDVFVHLSKDTNGFAKIIEVSKESPEENNDYIKAKVRNVTRDSSNVLTVSYPFDRLYMEEKKAYQAEQEYRKSQIDTSKSTYALVSVKAGKAVIKDVMIDSVSIYEIVRKK